MPERLGVWIIGARGGVSTCTIAGALAVAKGLEDTTGLSTELADFKPLNLTPLSDFVFGGHELRSNTTLTQAAQELHDVPGIISSKLINALGADFAAIDKNIRPATALGCGSTIQAQANGPTMDNSTGNRPKTVVDNIQSDIRDFQKRHNLRQVIVINLSSTEPLIETPPAFYSDPDAYQNALNGNADGFTAGTLYAWAAISAGYPFINFTPTAASDIPAISELARRKKVAHAGKDGKTGETLMKTVLAPMFVARNLKVMSWEGFNIFGNRDAVVLDDPKNNAAKTKGKDKALREILGDTADLHTRVRIDYCPSLDDWKTAWNFIHFKGFCGTKMILQFIWQGCDSMLAAPLAIDLIRLMDYSQSHGMYGVQKHLACYFKNPMENETHDFWRQWDSLKTWTKSQGV